VVGRSLHGRFRLLRDEREQIAPPRGNTPGFRTGELSEEKTMAEAIMESGEAKQQLLDLKDRMLALKEHL
jgi:hypothetical protein